MSSLHHWLVALGRGLKRDKHKRRIEEEARRDRLKLEAYREQMRAEALVEVERLGMMGGRPHEMHLGTYRRPERPKRLEAPDESHHHPIPDEPPFLPVLPMSFDPPAASMPDPSPRFDPGGGSSGGAAGRMEAGDGHARRQARRPWSTSDSLKRREPLLSPQPPAAGGEM
jgi:hypothetical protein